MSEKPYQVLYDYSDAPTLRDFAMDNTRIRCVLGPFGSGKSSACVMEIIRRAHEQKPSADGIRRSRWGVVRNSYRQLLDTTVKTFHDWFPPKLFGEWKVTDHDYFITAFEGIQLEIKFRALDRPDQISNLLSFEFTGVWINEAREIPQEIIEAIEGRIGRYPSMRDGGPSWYGIIMDSNPPDEGSYLYKQFEIVKPKGWKLFRQPSGLSSKAENVKFLVKDYYKNLASGKDERYVNVYVHGQYGFTVSGKPVFQSFSDSVHVSRNKLEPERGIPVVMGFDFGLCYDDKTEVLTNNGWKLFKHVSDDDLVATKNFESNAIEYHKPQKRIAREHDGDMYLYETENVNFCVTPEHIIPCRKRYGRQGIRYTGTHKVTAEYLYKNTTKHYAVDLRGNWIGDSTGVFGPLEWKSSVFAEFMGLYLSEGSSDRRHNRISIAQKLQNMYFQKILDDTGLDWVRGEKSWRISNAKLNSYLLQFGHSYDKYVPDEIKNMEISDILKFIYSYTEGDGHIRTRKNGSVEHTIFTVSKKMADDFQELALKVGWHARIRPVAPQKSTIIENGIPRDIVNNGGYSITFKKKKGTCSELKKKNFKKIKYSGTVYCLTVPNGTLYVRRNFIPSWNGNSPSCVIGQVTHQGQLRILDELVSDGMGLRQFCINRLLPLLRQKYFGMRIVGFGDPAGSARAQTDESTCFDILHSEEIGLPNIEPAPTNALVPRISAVESFLNKMYAGEPGFLMSSRCSNLRKAMNGAYHYEKEPRGKGDDFKNVPCKNSASHICFSADTMIMTTEGEKRIDSIKEGDFVLTPFGNRMVTKSMLTQKDAQVYEIGLSNGRNIICTGDHEFILEDQSIAKCNALRYTDVLQNYYSWRTLKWSIQILLNSKVGNIGFRKAIITEQRTGANPHATYGKKIETLRERALFVVKTLLRIKHHLLRPAPKIVRISQCQEPRDVYSITVDVDHVYYANGVLACNCDALQMLCLYLVEDEERKKRWRQFSERAGQHQYRPADRVAGY